MAKLFLYDGSFEGFLSCVFHAYPLSPEEADFCEEDRYTSSFFAPVMISTQEELVQRVKNGIFRVLTEETFLTCYHAWLSHQEGIEKAIFSFLKLSFAQKRCLCGYRQHPQVYPVVRAARQVENEAHKLTGLLRFEKRKSLYVADIRPTSDVLPIIAGHFLERLNDQPFLIRDRRYMQALLYNGKQAAIQKFSSFEELPFEEEEDMEQLWKAYYKAIGIQQRKNPKLQRQFMPKKYWEFLPEVSDRPEAHPNGFEKAVLEEQKKIFSSSLPPVAQTALESKEET